MNEYRFKMNNPLFDPNKEYTWEEIKQVIRDWTAEMRAQSEKWHAEQKQYYQKKREQYKGDDLEYIAALDKLLSTY